VLGRRRGADRGDDTIDSRDQWKPGEESGMDVRRIIGRFGRRLLWCTLGSMFALGPGMASAQDACANLTVNDDGCQNQVQAPISYNGWETKSWAYYCTGDHPDFAEGDDHGYDYGNTCFTATENTLAENDNFDGNFTNWCIGTQNLVIVLACFPHDPD
jgi:hypothetical protein